MAKILKCDFQHKEVKPKNGKTFNLNAEVCKVINCLSVEPVYLYNENGESNGKLLLVDEEGKYAIPLRLNLAATELYWKGRMSKEEYKKHSAGLNLFGAKYVNKLQIDFIAGDCMYCDLEQIK